MNGESPQPLEPRESYRDLTAILLDPSFPVETVLRQVEVMPDLACHVLGRANSSDVGNRTPVDRLDRAIILLGRSALLELVRRLFSKTTRDARINGLDKAEFVAHHLVTAEAAALVARAACLPIEHEARTAGLLHDLGIQLLAESRPWELASAWSDSKRTGSRMIDHERLLCGTDHTQLAEELLLDCQIPPSLALAIGSHHDPLTADADHRYLAMVLYAAECLALRAGYGDFNGEQDPLLESEVLDGLRLSSVGLDAQVGELRRRLGPRGDPARREALESQWNLQP